MNEKEILRITTTLGNSKDSYYVYMLCENIDGLNKPFYIGKGIGNRVLQHESDAAQELKDRKIEITELLEADKTLTEEERSRQIHDLIVSASNEISEKYKKIDTLGADNVIKIIVKWGLTEHEAFMTESALINAYCISNGRNSLTNIVNGHMSEREKSNVSCKTRARTLQEFLDECAVAEKCITEIKEPTLFLKIKGLYPLCMQLPENERKKAIYDSCRACWRLNEDKVKEIKYVFALYNSQVVGIYHVNEQSWKQRFSIDDSFPTFPIESRLKEIKYGNLSKKCSTLEEMKAVCKDFNEFLSVAKIDGNDEDRYNKWRNRYYFSKADEKVPNEILEFMNCILVKPNGEKFFSGKGNQSENMYNFDIKRGTVFIKDGEDY